MEKKIITESGIVQWQNITYVIEDVGCYYYYFFILYSSEAIEGSLPHSKSASSGAYFCTHWNTNRLLKHSPTNKVEKGIPFSKCLLTRYSLFRQNCFVLRNGPFIPCMYSDTCPIFGTSFGVRFIQLKLTTSFNIGTLFRVRILSHIVVEYRYIYTIF